MNYPTKKKKKKKKKSQIRDISALDQRKKKSTNNEHPIIIWSDFQLGVNKKAKGKLCLSKCESSEIEKVINMFQKLENTTWGEILRSHKNGLGYTKVDEKTGLSEFRVTKKMRAFGIRQDQYFKLLFLDPNHNYFK